VMLILLVQLVIVYRQAFGLIQPSDTLTTWLLPVHLDTDDKEDVSAAVALSCTKADVGRYNIVGVELPWFNANSLSFFAAKQLLSQPGPCYYTSLGYAESDPERAWQRLIELKVRHFL